MPSRTPATPSFLADIAEEIWSRKYRFSGSASAAGDQSLDATFWRVARAAASAERGEKKRERWAQRFHEAMSDFGFLPGGRIISGAGTNRDVTLFNCFVLGRIEDDLTAIFDGVKDAALTMQAGGGIGHDFSTLRPKGAEVKSIGADASGPVSFMDVWDAMCRTIQSAGQRRGAMMATLRCDHPDIDDFIAAKSDARRLRNFNLSVLVTDAFMNAVRRDASWDLVFAGVTYKTVSARELWDKLMRATYDYAEPGVIFIDRINAQNNLAYCETISATNPCGEQPLPPFGACLLGSINLAALTQNHFTVHAGIDDQALHDRTRIAIRFLDNIIDISRYPLVAQKREAKSKRRLGLGITGLADALIYCGLHYGSHEARAKAAHWMAIIQNAAYQASAELAAEKGTFKVYDAAEFAARPNVTQLDANVRAAIAKHGLRNGCLTSIAPTGTISLLAGNVSSGIEPVFGFSYQRRVRRDDGTFTEEVVQDLAYRTYCARHSQRPSLPPAFVIADQLTPADHLNMQAALQPFVDSAISKTINCPEHISFEAFRDIYSTAYDIGLKGCTTYRPNPITGSILSHAPSDQTTSADTLAASDAESKLPASTGLKQPTTPAIVYMTKPLERDVALEGFTYKIKWPASPNALYVTINDIERDGRRRPFEIFINTKNLEHYAWTVALTRMISAVFRRGGDVAFVAEELKAIFDPEGGRWMAGRYVPSLLAAIGDVIEQHMMSIGFIVPEQGETPKSQERPQRAQLPATRSAATANTSSDKTPFDTARNSATAPSRTCPQCGERKLYRSEGCWTCTECQYSQCN